MTQKTNIYILAFSASIIFFLLKLAEMKYTDNENLTIQRIIRDTVIVYISMVGGHFIVSQIIPEEIGVKPATAVFTDPPNF